MFAKRKKDVILESFIFLLRKVLISQWELLPFVQKLVNKMIFLAEYFKSIYIGIAQTWLDIVIRKTFCSNLSKKIRSRETKTRTSTKIKKKM